MTGKLSKSGKEVVNDQAVIRAMSPPGRDTAKWLARLMEIPVRTARFWAEQTVPIYRREEVGQRLLERYYAKRKWEEDYLLPEILKMAGIVNEVEIVSSTNLANAAAGIVGAAAARVDAVAYLVKAASDWINKG